MANKKITALTAITALDVADVLPVADVSIPETKKITAANLWLGGFNAHKDTDGTFAANSDLVFPTQKAAKTYVDTAAVAKNGSNLAIGSDADGDMYYRASSKLARLAKGTAGQVLTMNSGATAPEWGTVASGLPLGYLSGLTIAHAADTEHDITVAVGEARDATDAADMVLASAITKRFDAEWAVGDAAGGFASGESLPASGTIHIWLIKRSDTGVVDVFANDHATSGLTPTLPTDYDYKRRIFSLRTDASNNIINGDQWGAGLVRRWKYDSPTLDVDAVQSTYYAARAAAALPVPGGICVQVIMNLYASPGSAYVSSLDNADVGRPSNTVSPLKTGGPGLQAVIKSNTSSQIGLRGENNNNDPIRIVTLGWEDSL